MSPVRNAALSALGGTMWFSGNVLYVISNQVSPSHTADALTDTLLGARWSATLARYDCPAHDVFRTSTLPQVIGWPIFMISMILASNIFGIAKGICNVSTSREALSPFRRRVEGCLFNSKDSNGSWTRHSVCGCGGHCAGMMSTMQTRGLI